MSKESDPYSVLMRAVGYMTIGGRLHIFEHEDDMRAAIKSGDFGRATWLDDDQVVYRVRGKERGKADE